MKIGNAHFAYASLASAVLCSLPYILLLDEYSRESEFAPQIVGYFIASFGVLIYYAIFASVLLWRYFVLKNNGGSSMDKHWAKSLFYFGIVVSSLYMCIGIVCFQGMYFDNTIFYLVSRFAPYFVSIFFCLLASIFVTSSANGNKVPFKQIIPCFPPLFVLVEKIFIGRITCIDILFAIAYLIIYAIFVGVRKKANSKA